MPITGPTSYLTTTDEFRAHWGAANTTLGVGNEVVLPGGKTLTDLDNLKNSLVTKRAGVQAKLNLEEAARGDVENKKTALHLRINQFNDAVRSDMPGSKYERTLANVPGIGEGQGNFTIALDDAKSGWALINADPAVSDIVLLGAYTQPTFVTDVAALGTAYETHTLAAKVTSITIAERNDIQDVLYEIFLAYRKKLPTKFAKDHALVETLPLLTPPPGSTPKAVVAGISWDATQQKAKITCSESTDPNLYQYEVRYCVGPNYSTDNEAVAGNIAAGGPRELFTDIGFGAPGTVVSFKVYVITTTGNEKGSNTVTLIRPAAPLP